MQNCIVRVVLDYPLNQLFDYRYPFERVAQVGMLVEVPFGRTQQVGVIWACVEQTQIPLSRLKEVIQVCEDLPALSQSWLSLCQFAAQYYEKSLGEVILPALPSFFRKARDWPRLFEREALFTVTSQGQQAIYDSIPRRALALQRWVELLLQQHTVTLSQAKKQYAKAAVYLEQWLALGWVKLSTQPDDECDLPSSFSMAKRLPLNDAQTVALNKIEVSRDFTAFLLFGITGSGKTEVYLQAMLSIWQRQPDAQILLLAPEINLIAHMTNFFRSRLQSVFQDQQIVTLHSGLSEKQRSQDWLRAHLTQARLIIGTRLAVLASVPKLALIIVDEEHDASYKQQEGVRYSARDLAVWRAKHSQIPVILGSATPSLESWLQVEKGKYQCLMLPQRAVQQAVLPNIRLIDLKQEALQGKKVKEGISPSLLAAIALRLEKKEQSLIFLNRRGYAPVLSCDACGWLSECTRCSVFSVFHKKEHCLRCHHCGLSMRIPVACPACGNPDIQPLGQGTQKIEEVFADYFPQARVLRIDADSTRLKGQTEALLSEIHQGEVDILVGTQMIAKGHDFQRVSLVGVLNADQALFSADFRSRERLFAQLMQVSGRAGRAGLVSEVLIQTRYIDDPLFQALIHQDYAAYAKQLLLERQQAHLPPFVFQVLLCAEARRNEDLMHFLHAAQALLLERHDEKIVVYDPVPRVLAKIKHQFRAQLLIESGSRAHLHAILPALILKLKEKKFSGRWFVEVDPLEI